MKKKTIALLLALMLCFGCAIGGTVAWLIDSTSEVKNTFTASDINIDLTESTGDEYKMVPGSTITKNPKVTVEAGSEACWLFVKIEESATEYTVDSDTYSFDNFLEYAVAEGWTLVTGKTDVYYRVVDASIANQEFAVIKDNQLTVKATVTKAMMDAIEDDKEPTLTITAYAIQSENLTYTAGATTDALKAAEAYALANPNP